ncbi:MAG: hypothetical protein EGR26_03130 [Clostridiales bacterium]|nr:hypothetical protein [Clostridiales bacterium]
MSSSSSASCRKRKNSRISRRMSPASRSDRCSFSSRPLRSPRSGAGGGGRRGGSSGGASCTGGASCGLGGGGAAGCCGG